MKSVLLLAVALGFSAAAQAQISVPPSTTQNPAPVPAGTGTIVINADLGRTTISRNIYGQFAEHLGRDIYGGFWVQENGGAGTAETGPPTGPVQGWHYNMPVIAALRKLHIPNLRWPGGCFADYYHWEDGVGPRESRPTMINTHWGNVVEDNSFGTHEYLGLVDLLGTEPYIVANVGSGTVQEMLDWWEYLNHPGGSTLADRRIANGRTEPAHVQMWGIGNESWGCGGSMTAEHYANLYKQFATLLTEQGGATPFRVATGPNFGDYAWTDDIMRMAGPMIDGLDFHYYTTVGPWENKGQATGFGENEWYYAMFAMQRIESILQRHATIMDTYDPEKRVALIVGEWGIWHDVPPGTNEGFLYQQSTLRDALVASVGLDIFNNHADRVRGANIAQAINVLQSMVLTQGDDFILTPTYHVFEFYTVHQDATLLPISVQGGLYTFNGNSIPAISASASRDSLGVIHVTMSNLDPHHARTITTDIRGVQTSRVSGRILTAPEMASTNTFEHRDVVSPAPFTGARFSGGKLMVDLPPMSVVVLTLG